MKEADYKNMQREEIEKMVKNQVNQMTRNQLLYIYFFIFKIMGYTEEDLSVVA